MCVLGWGIRKISQKIISFIFIISLIMFFFGKIIMNKRLGMLMEACKTC